MALKKKIDLIFCTSICYCCSCFCRCLCRLCCCCCCCLSFAGLIYAKINRLHHFILSDFPSATVDNVCLFVCPPACSSSLLCFCVCSRTSSPRKDLRPTSSGPRAPRNWIESGPARTSPSETREYSNNRFMLPDTSSRYCRHLVQV